MGNCDVWQASTDCSILQTAQGRRPRRPENRVGAYIIRPFKNHSGYCFVILSNLLRRVPFRVRILALDQSQTLLRCVGVTFGGKSNQNRGGCDSPTPQRYTSVVCSVCYKSEKITNLAHYVLSHCNFSSIYTSISPPVSYATLCLPWLSACSPQTSPFIFGESISPNPFLSAKLEFENHNFISGY